MTDDEALIKRVFIIALTNIFKDFYSRLRIGALNRNLLKNSIMNPSQLKVVGEDISGVRNG